MIDPKKKISNPAADLIPAVNRKPVIKTTVRGSDAKGSYTDTNTNQADDSYPGKKPTHTANSWYNGLSQAQKNSHNTAQRAKDSAAASAITVKGASSTSRVYDPAKTAKPAPAVRPAPVTRWTSQTTVMPFGSHSTRGITSDDEVIAAGNRKNAVDIKGVDSNKNTFSSRPYSSVENKLDKIGQLRLSDNPYSSKDTTGRGAGLNARLMEAEMKRAKFGMAKKEEGGKMPMRSMKNMKSKAVVVTKKGKSSDCGCDGAGKMQTGGSLTTTPMAPTLPKPAASMIFPSKAKMQVNPLQMEMGKTLTRGAALEMMQKRRAQPNFNSSSQKSGPFGDNAFRAEQVIRNASSVPYGTKAAAPMFSRGGGVPDIDEESPIRYR